MKKIRCYDECGALEWEDDITEEEAARFVALARGQLERQALLASICGTSEGREHEADDAPDKRTAYAWGWSACGSEIAKMLASVPEQKATADDAKSPESHEP